MKSKGRLTKLLKNIYITLIYLFLYAPIILVILFSFNTSKMNIKWEGFTLKWYGSFFSNHSLMESLTNTLIIAVISTAIATIIGTLGAVGLSRYEFRLKKYIDKLLYIPIVIPEIVLGISLLAIFSIFNIPLGLVSITIAHITFSVPFVVITVRATLAGLDYRLEEAAMDLGANRWTTFKTITLPLLMPGVVSGATLAFALSIDDVVISFFTCGPDSMTLPIKILSMVKTGITPEVNALSAVIMFVAIVIISVKTYFSLNLNKSHLEETSSLL